MKGLIGKKLGMTQVYDENGVLIPVTVIEVGPCVVTAVKTVERDGYSAIQLGYGSRKAKNVTKACQGHLAKAGVSGATLPAVLREIRTHKRMLDIVNPNARTVDELKKLNLPAGVDISIKTGF